MLYKYIYINIYTSLSFNILETTKLKLFYQNSNTRMKNQTKDTNKYLWSILMSFYFYFLTSENNIARLHANRTNNLISS